MWKMYILVGLALLPCILLGYPTGPPPERCDNMRPEHYGGLQTTSPPYEITFSPNKLTYTNNELIQVTLKGKAGQQFRGFMIEPRPSADNYTTFGSLHTIPNNARNPCSNERANKNVALSHNNKIDKSSITFTWQAPPSDVGNIVFVFTVVEVYAAFWLKGTSNILTYTSEQPTQSPTGSPTDPVTEPPTVSSTEPPKTTQQSTSSMINRDPECGKTKGCFPAPSECSTSCDYLVTWKESGTEDIEFSIQRKTTESNYYIAIGLSSDPRMGDDSVTECVSLDGAVNVQVSHNIASDRNKMNRRLDTPNFGITWIDGSYSDGILSCTFKRKKTAALAVGAFGRRRRAAADESTFFDLNTEWYLLVAHGKSVSGSLTKHAQTPEISETKIDFLKVDGSTENKPDISATGMIKKDRKCGESLGCYHDCKDGGSCGFLLTWREVGDYIDFTLTCKRGGSNVYCAIGLSSDNKMGDDSVFECVHSGDVTTVYVSYNDGRSNSRLDKEQFGLSSVSATYENGILSCSFSRQKTVTLATSTSTGRKKRATASSDTYFDMNKDWTLLYAYGKAIGGYVSKHSVTPTISTKKADFQSFMDISAESVDRSMIKLHGILMTLAWMFFAVFGIFMARFYKLVWPEGMEWCEQKRWFIVHRSCMVTAFLLTAASFIVIFVHVGGYAEIEGTDFEKSHPIIGIVVMCLALINPIMAVFRPHPGTSKRPIFNVGHTLVGIGAVVCAIVNIFSGTILAGSFVPDYVRIVLWVAVGWCGLIEILSYIYDCLAKRENSGQAYELKAMDGSSENEQDLQKNDSQVKIVILWIHLFTLVGLTAAVCVIIGIGDQFYSDIIL